jgi:hypothetical protein
MSGKTRSSSASPRPNAWIRRNILGLVAVSAALLAVAASSASAATISPASSDFGRLLIGKTSAPRTFTVTKGSEATYQMRGGGDGGDFVINNGEIGVGGGHPAGFAQSSTTCFDRVLTATNPSCTISVVFSPNLPGPNPAVVFADDLSTAPLAQLTGIGMIPRGSFFCRTRNGHPVHKALWKYCVKTKKEK